MKEQSVSLYCDACGCAQLVEARMVHCDYCHADVTSSCGECHIDWDTADICGDFEYVCQECGKLLAHDMDEIEQKLKGQTNEQ